MKKNLYIKSSLRSYVMSLFFLVVMSLASFLFTLHSAEYLLTRRQINEVSNYYRPIGSLVPMTSGSKDVALGAELVKEYPKVFLHDERRKFPAVLDGVYNADLDGVLSCPVMEPGMNNVHTNDVLFYGTLVDITEENRQGFIDGYTNENNYRSSSRKLRSYHMVFAVDAVEAGYPDYIVAGEQANVYLYRRQEGADSFLPEQLQAGTRYLIKACYDINLAEIDAPYRDNLTLKMIDDSGNWYLPVAKGEEPDFGLPEFAGLKQELEAQEENRHTLFLTATKDMTYLPGFQEVNQMYYLDAGRLLDRKDHEKRNPVCVVRKEFAKLRGLSLGDTLSLTIRDLGGQDLYGYINDNTGSWADAPVFTADFEIVGTCGGYPGEFGLDSFSAYFNDIYIPSSCVPEEFGGSRSEVLDMEDFSFVLNTPEDQKEFISQMGDQLSKYGLEASFVEKDTVKSQEAINSIKQSTLIKLCLFGGLYLLMMAVLIFLYLKNNLVNFAIQRVLGIPARTAARQLMLPVELTALVALAAGGLLGWRHAMNQTDQLMQPILETAKVTVADALPGYCFLALYGVMLFVVSALLLGGVKVVCQRRILELFQKISNRRKQR
ncbi:hypothetical protein ABXS75_08170 [Roseburia hominis]